MPFISFDEPTSKGGFVDFDAPEKPAEQRAGILGTLAGGIKGTMRAVGGAIDVAQGDNEELGASVREQQAERKDPRLEAFMSEIAAWKKGQDDAGTKPDWIDTAKALGSAAWNNPAGAGLMIAEQLPNSAVSMGAGYGGMKAGGILGGAVAGPPGAAAGAVIGGIAGLFAANTTLETGNKAIEARQAGPLSDEQRMDVMGQGARKGAVITGIDAATLGLTNVIGKATTRAVESATVKTLSDAGINIADKAAVMAARQNPTIVTAVQAAQKTAADATTTLGQRAMRTGGQAALETFGEGAGEYLGEYAASGELDKMEALIEAFSSAGTSAAEIALTKTWGSKATNEAMWGDAPAAKPAAPLLLGNTPDPLIGFPDGTVGRRSEVEAYVSKLPEDQQVAARAKLMGMGARDAKPEDILAAPDADSAIAAFTASLTGTDVGGMMGQDNPLIAPARAMQAQAAADEADLADLAQTETRDLNTLRAQLDLESRKQVELDAIQATGTGQYGIQPEARPAVEQAATVEAPTAMQLAMQRAKAAVIPNEGQPLPMTAPRPVEPAAPTPAPEAGIPASRQPDILPADIARLDGKPFQTANGAKLKQREAGGVEKSDIVPVAGGFVVRPKPTQENPSVPQADQSIQSQAQRQEPAAAVAPVIETSPAGQPAEGGTVPAQAQDQRLIPVSKRQPAEPVDLTDDETTAEFERLYQEDIKADIRRRLGMEPPAKEPAQRASPFRTFLRQYGISPQHASDITGERGIRANNRLPATFRRNGLPLDELALRAVESGYLTQADLESDTDNGGTNKMMEMIQAEIRGERQETASESNDSAEAQLERVRRAELEGAADALGIPYPADIDSMVLASMVSRVQRAMDASREPKGSTKADRVRQNAIAAAKRIEAKRQKYERELEEFAKASIREQNAFLEVLLDDEGTPVVNRLADQQADDAWNELLGAWEDQNGQTETPAEPPSRQAGTPDGAGAAQRPGDAQEGDSGQQRGSDQGQEKELEAGPAEIAEAKALTYRLPYLQRLLDDKDLIPTDAFLMHLLATSLPKSREYNRMMIANKGDLVGIEFQKPNDGKYPTKNEKYAVALPDASRDGKWRVSYFDLNGFSSHESHATREEAQQALAQEGFTIQAEGTLDRLAATDDWARGTDYADLIMDLNRGAITHAQFIEKQKALNDSYEAKKAGGLTAPTRADVLRQQDAADNATANDQRAQIDREAGAQTLTAQTAPEQRRDTTGDIFGGPSPEEAMAAKAREDEAKAKKKAAEDAASGQAGMFDDPVESDSTPEPAAQASQILDAANVTGKDRLDILKDVKSGALTPGEVQAAFPGVEKPAAPAPKPGEVDNFGEALPPARRNMAAKLDEELADSDIANRPLSEIWPLAENQAIEDTFAAAVAHAARAEVPSKPRVAYKLKQWVQKVKTVRELAAMIVSGRFTREQFIAKAPASLKDWLTKVMLLEQIPRDQWNRVEAVEERPDSFSYKDGKQVKMPHLSIRIDGKSHWLTGDTGIDGDVRGTLNGNRAGIMALLSAAEPEERMQFEIRQRRGGKVFINKKGDSEYRALMEFDTAEDARKAITGQYDDLVAAWEATKARDNITERDLRSAENRPRAGKDHRSGRDVTPEEFQSKFGFRGGEFGKWVKQGKGDKERQAILNSAYDALMDLADIAGVPPKAISLNGTLGIAFGSRGSGWASAHFEPGNLVMNLTKTRGAGALAHEWFHALDNYFSRMRRGGAESPFTGDQNEYRSNNYITHRPEPMMVPKNVMGGRYLAPMTLGKLQAMHEARKDKTDAYNPDNWQRDPKTPEGVRPEVEARFAALVDRLNESPMTQRARKLDGVKSGEGYWSRTLERAARAFESYVIAKMHDEGYHNDFLVNVKKSDETGKAGDRYPYLMAGEVKPIAEAFDALFDTIQTKEDDAGNVAMFARGNTSRGVNIDDANAVVAAVREALPTAPTIHIIESVSQAPAELRKFIRAAGAENDVDAAYHQGEIYVFPANIPSIERMQFVLAHHEIRHHGLAAMLGPRKNAVMLKIHESNPKIRALASEQVRKGYAKSRILATEEALADMPVEDLVQLNGWDKVVAAVREWLRGAAARLRRAGLSNIADAIDAKEWTDKDVAALIARAEGVSRGGSARYASEGTVFGKDESGIRSGTEEQARAAGFTMKAYRGVDKANPFNDSGTTWLTTDREVAEAYAEEVMGYDDPDVLTVMVKPDDLPRHDASRLSDEQREAMQSDGFGNPQALGIYDRSDDHPLGGSRRNVTVIHAPREAVFVVNDGALARTGDQTSTAAFLKWFGKSKVVNPDGSPMRVYHGTASDVRAFGGTGIEQAMGGTGRAHFFTPNPDRAGDFAAQAGDGYDEATKGRKNGENVMPVYLALKNPLVVTDLVEEIDDMFDMIAQAQKDGHDGVMFERTYDHSMYHSGEWDERVPVYVAFNPTQIKSAIGNSGDFSATNPDIRFARSAVTGQPLAQTWQGPDESRMDAFLYSMQDKHIDTKRVVTAVRDAIGGIADNLDPYLQEELYHGRAAKSTKDFLEQSIRPLMVDMQARGVEMSDFEEYLHNRHAERRNVQVAKVNPAMQDGGSGIKTADARAYLAGLPAAKRAAYQALAKRVDQMTKETRALLVSSGLEKQSMIDAWDAAYGDEYVPLMREEMDNGAMGIGQGFSVRGGSSKRAMGSDKPVANILANIALQREKAITRSEKRRIGEALYGMVLSAPNPDFWFAVDPALQQSPAQITATSMQLISMGMNPIDAEQIAAEPTQRYIDPRTGQVASRINPALRSAENVLAVRMDGEDKYVFFNARDPRAMRMAKALKNMDADQLGMVMGNVAKATRYFAAVNTQWNPIFGVVNLTRDIQAALLNLQSTALKGKQAEVMKHVGSALRGIYIDLRDHRAGKTPSSTWANLFEEFQNEGGATGYRDMYANAQERADAIADELKKIKQGKAMALGRGFFGWLSDYNETMENAVRLATYKVAKEQGMSNQQAASLAKNLTTNFNRKGQVALQAGALFAFFNAAVQGTARLSETMFEPGKVGKLSGLGKKIMTGGLLLGSMQALLLAAAGFDDEEPPDFVRERSLVIPDFGLLGGDKYISIPMPLGFHVIPSLARIPTEWAMGGFKDTPKRIGQLVSLFADAFNPIGSAGLSLQTLAPTIIDPLAALAENRDWTGKPIAKKDFNSMQPTAGHLRAKDTATPWARAISYGVNWVTGGTDYKPGLASPTPDQIDYLIGQATGGVGREVSKLSQVAGSTVSGEELPLYKIPLLGRFVGTTAGQAAESGRFYSNLKEIGEHDAELTGLKKDRRMAEYQVYVRDNPQARLVPIAERTYREVSKLNRAKRDAIKAGASAERVKLIDQQITARMKQFNDRVLATEKRETATQE